LQQAGGLRRAGPLVDIGRRLALRYSSAATAAGICLRDAAAEIEIRNTEDVMPKAKGRKAAAKHLHKGKKLEATKPLRVAAKSSGKQEFVTFKMNEVLVSNYNT
jgi:hypothetical protein